MKALLIPLAACAALAGCAADPYYGGYGYGYGYPGYATVDVGPAYYGGVYGNVPIYRSERRGLGDRDRDGIPNRMDRDRDNDGIPNRMDRDRDGDGIPNRADNRPNNPRR